MGREFPDWRTWVSAILVTVLLCGASFGLANLFHGHGSTSYGSVMTINTDEIKQVECVSDGVIFYNGSSLTKIGTNGHSKWSYMLGYDAGFKATNAGISAWEGQNLTLIDANTGETRYTGSFDSTIRMAKVGKMYTAVLLDPQLNSTLIVMEESGRLVDSLTLEDKMVIDFGFFYDSSLLWVMTLDSNGTTPSCTISVYRPGKRQVGSITDGEQLLYRPIFQQSEIICGGDSYLKTFTYSGQEQKDERKLLYGYVIADVCEKGNTATIVTVPNDQFSAGSEALQDIRVLKGNLDTRLRMPFPCVGLIAGTDSVYGFSNDGYLMIANIHTREVLSYSLGANFAYASGITDDGYAVLYDSNHIYLVCLA